MPEVPEDLFFQALVELVKLDKGWVRATRTVHCTSGPSCLLLNLTSGFVPA